MNKKAIAILGAIFLLIVGTLGFLIYSKTGGTDKNSGTNPTPTPTPIANSPTPTPITTPTLDGNGVAKIYKLTDDQVVSPALTFDGNGVAYFTKQGLLYRATFSQNSGALQIADKKQLAIETKPGISKVIWPANTQDFVLVYDNGSKKTFEFYNNALGQFIKLDPQVYSLGFLPSGDKIFYVWSNQAGNDSINISAPDLKDYKTLSDIWDKNAVVYVSPDGQNVAYHQDPSTISGTSNPLMLTDTEGKTWHKVTEGFVSGVLWSPDGKKLLFSKKDPSTQNYQLWYYDLYSGEIKNLGLNTMPEKAVWGFDNQTIYAAVPKSIGAALGNSFSLDMFYKLNIQTSEKKSYDAGSMELDGRDLFLSQDNNKLFFRSAQDGGLYYLDLSQ
jgi:hypothetical protein